MELPPPIPIPPTPPKRPRTDNPSPHNPTCIPSLLKATSPPPPTHPRDGASPQAVDAAVAFLRRRFCQASSVDLMPDAQENKRKLYELLSHTVSQACNNSALLLGPRGCGKSLVLNQVVEDLHRQYPGRISIVRLSGLIHSDDQSALKEIAKQLCAENDLTFSKSASFDENSKFMATMLREYALSHKTVLFVLDDFDLFAQMSKQKLLYNLLNIMQSADSQAAVIGISCRLDADQLLEKRVRSRFSHRKLLFLPPLAEDLQRFLRLVLSLPTDSSFPYVEFAKKFNAVTMSLLEQNEMKDLIQRITAVDLSPRRILDFVFRSICELDREQGFPSITDFKTASLSLRRRPKLELLRDASVLELYLLVSMKRLEGKDRDTYNFLTVLKEYKSLHDTHSTCDLYSQQVCQRAFENLLERELIMFVDGRTHKSGIEFRPVKLLVSSFEIEEGLKSSPVCPMVLHQWFAHEEFK